MPLTLCGFFFPQIKTLSRISMERVPQAVDKAEAKHHEADMEGVFKNRKEKEGGRKQVKKTGFQCSSLWRCIY